MLYRILKITSFFIFAICLSACQPKVDVPISGQQFFDLKSFFEKEQIRLKDLNQVIKKAIIDGKPEEKTVNEVNLKAELALFVDSDINKIAWLDRYETDSISSNGQLKEIIYQAKDDKLKTNRLSIQFEKKVVKRIEIIRKTSSIAADLDQQLIYQPQQGYSIKSRQQTSLSSPHVLELDVRFVQ